MSKNYFIMNKIIYSLFIALFLFGSCETNDRSETENTSLTKNENVVGIDFFEGTWAEALAKAKKDNKLIFLDISASWCGPCKQLKRTTFKDSTVGNFYNEQFINVELDGEKGEGIRLAQQYKLRGYPSLYFINSDGFVVKETAGFLPAAQFIEYGQSVAQ